MTKSLSEDLRGLASAFAGIQPEAVEGERLQTFLRFLQSDVVDSLRDLARRAAVLEGLDQVPGEVIDLRDVFAREQRERFRVVEGGAA